MDSMMKILKMQAYPYDRVTAIEYILQVARQESCEPEWWLTYAYDLGRIDGIRQERARRKKTACELEKREQANGENDC